MVLTRWKFAARHAACELLTMATKRKTPTTSTITRETTTSAPMRVQRPAAKEVSNDDIARRAHEKFLERGGQHGYDVEDWLAAEAELRG